MEEQRKGRERPYVAAGTARKTSIPVIGTLNYGRRLQRPEKGLIDRLGFVIPALIRAVHRD